MSITDGVNTAYTLFEQNPIIFGKYYFNHHFRDRSPYFHWIIIKESYENKFFACQAPRESAKSTMLAFIKPIHRIAFKQKRFYVIIQNTYKKAVETLETIKDECRWNERFKNDFGITFEKDAEGDTIFISRDGFRTRVLCKGVEQIGSVRGSKFGAYRPDAILCDDMEDDEMVKSPERRQNLKDLFDDALIKAGDKKLVDVDVIGTILHDDSLMAELVSKDNYTNYRKLFFKARYENKVSGDKESLWNEKWTVEELDEMERLKPASFAKEMQGDPSSGNMETVQREDFRYWDIIENNIVMYNTDNSIYARWSFKDCKAGIGVDLAWEEKQNNDFSAFMPGLVTPQNDLLFDYYINKKGLKPDKWEEICFNLCARYENLTGKRVPIGLEKSKLEKVMQWFLKEAMRRRNKWLWFKSISWGGKDKVERFISRLANRYAQHTIFHRRGMGEYENQAIRIRSAKHDDLCDCAGGLVEMLAFAPLKTKEKPKEDVFKFLQHQTSGWRGKNMRTSKYIFGAKERPSVIDAKVGLVATAKGVGF